MKFLLLSFLTAWSVMSIFDYIKIRTMDNPPEKLCETLWHGPAIAQVAAVGILNGCFDRGLVGNE